MKRLIVFTALAALATAAWAVLHVAHGHGVVEGGSYAGAHFDFRIRLPESHTHPNRFRFYDHGQFIPVNIVVPHPERIDFNLHSVSFSGRGWYNETTPVMVFVHAFDGGPHRPDRFRMVARGQGGVVVHSAEGEVIEGDIVVGHRQ